MNLDLAYNSSKPRFAHKKWDPLISREFVTEDGSYCERLGAGGGLWKWGVEDLIAEQFQLLLPEIVEPVATRCINVGPIAVASREPVS